MDAFFRDEGNVEEERWNDPLRGNIGFRTLLGDTPGTDSFVTGTARLPVGGLLALHRHFPPETYYVLEGRGVVTVSGVEQDVAAGSSVYIRGNAIHGIRNTGSETLRFFYALAADKFDDIDYQFLEVETDTG
ncbi:cupin domain-containing protein [Arthrobacter sp. Br18]|uniref:cupin domain-containing protein n=1 Tax=Arthrobacter sp. Br18 TaxID=1312954 RepID=UPI0004B45146|nr:cupin domain-containing protein [Arthrobacter sp. Br18]